MKSINMYVLPLPTYARACIDWTNEDLAKIHIDTRKILAFKKIIISSVAFKDSMFPENLVGKASFSLKVKFNEN